MDETKAAPPSISLPDIDDIPLPTGRPIKRSTTFYFDCVRFQVENVLYSLPRNRLIEESSIFEDMFTLPQGESGKMVEGSSDDNPIQLEQTKKKDWERLLKVLFHRHDSENSGPNLTLDEWVSVLGLATKWDMAAVRSTAIDKISSMRNPAKKIALARQYHVSKLFIPCLVELIGRSEPLTLTELTDLGAECALKIISTRERCYDTNNWGYDTSFRPQKIAFDLTPNSDNWNSIVNEIRRVFSDHEEYYK
ncbi:hypothetical protein D9757_013622 [Collybiopsis confluens]|uniref:BTB domain-containing protein n=1 Tax=Collybiopsis confluens TaxID=2823264 RepID=A0A8H5FUW6_9AGAR|nr:hypothetical protein D9757_013622 [Collybiopsis confluens]